MKFKIFTGSSVTELTEKIETWFSKKNVQMKFVTQSECQQERPTGKTDKDTGKRETEIKPHITITTWYEEKTNTTQ